jgi:hypothetical protein
MEAKSFSTGDEEYAGTVDPDVVMGIHYAGSGRIDRSIYSGNQRFL